jgi:hypothetical protein
VGELSTEIFEQHQAELLGKSYQELKAYFDENIRLFGVRYNTGSQYEKEWNTWCTAWRFQQSKIEPLEKRIEMIAKSIDSFFDEQTMTPSSREYSNFIAHVEKALRGECG